MQIARADLQKLFLLAWRYCLRALHVLACSSPAQIYIYSLDLFPGCKSTGLRRALEVHVACCMCIHPCAGMWRARLLPVYWRCEPMHTANL